MSKSSANPRRYSRVKEGIDHNEPVRVYVEIRCRKEDIITLEDRLNYLAASRPEAQYYFAGIRREPPAVVVTLCVDMGPVSAVMSGKSEQMKDCYDFLWDIWENLVEFSPVFSAQPAGSDAEAAHLLGFPSPPEYAEKYEKTSA